MEKRIRKRSLLTFLLIVVLACAVGIASLLLRPAPAAAEGDDVIALEEDETTDVGGNNLRTDDGEEISESDEGWTYGFEVKSYAFRAEHGNTVFYSYYNDDETNTEPIGQFALVYQDDTKEAVKSFYGVKIADGKLTVDDSDPYNDENYLYNFNDNLIAGNYLIALTVPRTEADSSHTHWWDSSAGDDCDSEYDEFVYSFRFRVENYNISDGSGANVGITVSSTTNMTVMYTGKADNVVDPVIKLNNKLLVRGIDYELSSTSVKVGWAVLTISGLNSLYGKFTIDDAYRIVKADNSWNQVPAIMQWTYDSFNREVNRIIAEPTLLDDPSHLWFAVATDAKGQNIYDGLEHFTIDSEGRVPENIADILKDLNAGHYYLVGQVEGNNNYFPLSPQRIPFTVFTATNSWAVTPSVKSWTEGKFTKAEDYIVAEPVYGKANIVIKGSDGKVYYDSEKNIDNLKDAEAGSYTLIATVEADLDGNYTDIQAYTVVFRIFEKPGFPWWAAFLIGIGALLVAALVILVLFKAGVFRIFSEKMAVDIRASASVDATIAAVRAAKREEEAKKSVAAAEAKERAAARKAAAKAEREKPANERAAAMEAKAQAQAARAEKIRLRAEAMQARAAKLRESADVKSEQPEANAEANAEAAATEEPKTEK
ncbi:MAG: hypothetical protein J1G01_00745 [Clostridiales bacterium]|nr:hypothetical protein [Clostridiales bacterium]